MNIKEKFAIKVTVKGVNIINSEKQEMHFTAGEALMLLDILKNEEDNLRVMAEKASPIPIKIN
jgi:hypothetical protein